MRTICNQHLQIKSFSIQITLILLNVYNLHSTPSNQILFKSNDLQYIKKCTNAFKPYKHSNQHFQPPNIHLYTSNASISKLPTYKPWALPSKYTYRKAYEQCLEWDDLLHLLPCPCLHFSSFIHTIHMEYLNSNFPQSIRVFSNLIHF